MVFSWQRFKMCYFSSWGSKNHGKLRNFETTLPKHQRSVHLRTFLSVINSFLATVTAKSLSAVPPKSIEIQAAQFHIQHWHKRGFSRILPTIALDREPRLLEPRLLGVFDEPLKKITSAWVEHVYDVTQRDFWHVRWHKHIGIETLHSCSSIHTNLSSQNRKTQILEHHL